MDLPLGERYARGGWWRIRGSPTHAPAAIRDSAAIQCPTCDRPFCVVNHTIAADGTISPSVVCAYVARATCTFHQFVHLLGWAA